MRRRAARPCVMRRRRSSASRATRHLAAAIQRVRDASGAVLAARVHEVREEPARGVARTSCASGKGSACSRACRPGALVVACDARGRCDDVGGVRGVAAAAARARARDVAFVIGGAFGLARARARRASAALVALRRGRCRTSSRASCSPSSCIAPARSCAASLPQVMLLSRRQRSSVVVRLRECSWSTCARAGGEARVSRAQGGVVRTAVPDHRDGGARGEAWRSRGTTPCRATQPHGAHVRRDRDQGAGDWARALAPAFDASGARPTRWHASPRRRRRRHDRAAAGPVRRADVHVEQGAERARARRRARSARPALPTAPVFWAATDDADFAEASVTHVAGDGARGDAHDAAAAAAARAMRGYSARRRRRLRVLRRAAGRRRSRRCARGRAAPTCRRPVGGAYRGAPPRACSSRSGSRCSTRRIRRCEAAARRCRAARSARRRARRGARSRARAMRCRGAGFEPQVEDV